MFFSRRLQVLFLLVLALLGGGIVRTSVQAAGGARSPAALAPPQTDCPGPNPFTNPGFETGTLAPWVVGGSGGGVYVVPGGYAGNYSAELFATHVTGGTHYATLTQIITVPASGGTLSFWYKPYNEASINGTQSATVIDNGHQTTIWTAHENTHNWTHQTYGMAAFAGHTVTLEFRVSISLGIDMEVDLDVDDIAIEWVVPCPTATPTPTNPPDITPTPVCTISYTDVDSSNPFYTYIRCLSCRGIVGGYTSAPPCAVAPCFLPGNSVTRGQTAKFISNAANYQDAIPSTQQTFTDVPPSSPFWIFVERAYLHGVIGGYTGSPPCTTGVPCFLPGNNVTRGQIAKFVSNAAGYGEAIPSTEQTFMDVPYNNAFWIYIERAYLHGVIGGYTSSPPCTTGVPCFLPGNNVTRGQISKFLANAFYPNCQTP